MTRGITAIKWFKLWMICCASMVPWNCDGFGRIKVDEWDETIIGLLNYMCCMKFVCLRESTMLVNLVLYID